MMNNYEHIKSMSLDEMANYWYEIVNVAILPCLGKAARDEVLQKWRGWLESNSECGKGE